MLSKLKKPITLFILTAVAIISLLPLYWVFSTALQLPSYQNEEMDRPVSYVESSPPKLYPAGIPEYFSQWSKKREAERNDDPEQAQIHAELMTEVREKTFGAFTKLFTTTPVMNWLFNSMYIAIVTTLLIVLLIRWLGMYLLKSSFLGSGSSFGSSSPQ
ncbi:hypothetical protein JCM19046_256 [Bacillus sp. JCM 19046]|nr:hypothetical protein JCM19046_256 [Bacillus sp. JCM 19046]